MNVTERIVRARFRKSIWEASELLTPGEVCRHTVELLPMARVFRTGHRSRLHVSSNRFPLWYCNTNTGDDSATDTEARVARQIIYHDAARPSQVVIPVTTGFRP